MKVEKEASVLSRYLLFDAKSFESGERSDGCSGWCQHHPVGQEGMGDMCVLVARRVRGCYRALYSALTQPDSSCHSRRKGSVCCSSQFISSFWWTRPEQLPPSEGQENGVAEKLLNFSWSRTQKHSSSKKLFPQLFNKIFDLSGWRNEGFFPPLKEFKKITWNLSWKKVSSILISFGPIPAEHTRTVNSLPFYAWNSPMK